MGTVDGDGEGVSVSAVDDDGEGGTVEALEGDGEGFSATDWRCIEV